MLANFCRQIGAPRPPGTTLRKALLVSCLKLFVQHFLSNVSSRKKRTINNAQTFSRTTTCWPAHEQESTQYISKQQESQNLKLPGHQNLKPRDFNQAQPAPQSPTFCSIPALQGHRKIQFMKGLLTCDICLTHNFASPQATQCNLPELPWNPVECAPIRSNIPISNHEQTLGWRIFKVKLY